MRILWINYGLLPIVCQRLGYQMEVSCGWVPALLDSIKRIESNIQFCVLSLDWRDCDMQIENVRYISMRVKKLRFSYSEVPAWLRDRIRAVIADFKPDVIHIHGTEYFFGCLPQDVYCGVPVVVSLQGIISGCARHMSGNLHPVETKMSDFCLRGLLKGQTIYGEQLKWLRARSAQEACVIKAQQNFIGRTEWDCSWVQYYNHGARYFHVDEVLRDEFCGASRCLSSVVRHSLYCGGAASCPLKGAHWLIYAVASLKDEFPDIQLRIAASADYLSGRRSLVSRLKEQSYHRYLRQLIGKLGVRNHIVALPQLPAEKVVEELAHAELFVLPSLCENSPNSLCEAMLVGVPSIATFVGGVPTILKDGVEGKLVPSGDPAALAAAIRRWFLHPEEAQKCVEPARRTAIRRHDAKRNAEATLAVYRELVASRK